MPKPPAFVCIFILLSIGWFILYMCRHLIFYLKISKWPTIKARIVSKKEMVPWHNRFVTPDNPENIQIELTYTYDINGTTYAGTGTLYCELLPGEIDDPLNSEFKHYKNGKLLEIHYNPRDMSESGVFLSRIFNDVIIGSIALLIWIAVLV